MQKIEDDKFLLFKVKENGSIQLLSDIVATIVKTKICKNTYKLHNILRTKFL